PLLLPVEDPAVAVAPRGGEEAPRRARADLGLGQAERADALEARHRRQPAPLLLLGAAEVDRAHREAAVDAQEGRHRRIDGGELHRDEPGDDVRAAGATVTLVAEAADAELAEARNHVIWKRRAIPMVIDDGLDALARERSHGGDELLIGR